MEAETPSLRGRLSRFEPIAWYALLALLTCAVAALFFEFASHAGTVSRSAAMQAEASVRQAEAAEDLNGTHARVAAVNEDLARIAHASKGTSAWTGPLATHTVETPIPDEDAGEIRAALDRHERVLAVWQERAPPK